MGIDRMPVINDLQQIIQEIDMDAYASAAELETDLYLRMKPYLNKPAGGGVASKLIIINIVVLLVVW